MPSRSGSGEPKGLAQCCLGGDGVDRGSVGERIEIAPERVRKCQAAILCTIQQLLRQSGPSVLFAACFGDAQRGPLEPDLHIVFKPGDPLGGAFTRLRDPSQTNGPLRQTPVKVFWERFKDLGDQRSVRANVV
jgi:hypothetical protein